jgi:serine palmitoyltransferase
VYIAWQTASDHRDIPAVPISTIGKMADHQNINILAPKPPTTEIPAPLVPILNILSSFLLNVTELFHRVPGSPIVVRYIQSSYQNDPWRSLLEVLLVAFAVRTIFKGRTRGEGEGKNWVKLTEKEIDELVDEWQPLSLVDEPARVDEETLASVPVIQGQNGVHVKLADNQFAAGKSVLNLASPDWTGMVESESMKQIAIETLKEYGVGSCGPGGFYGTIGRSGTSDQRGYLIPRVRCPYEV